MKIIHESGETYDLNPETKLEFNRSNPFFSEFGEQTIPITLPASPHNLRLLQNPNRPENKSKISTKTQATLQSGVFSLNARQAILSAQSNGNIQTSFYINNGALFERAKNISLMDIFADKVISFSSVDAAITFVRSLFVNRDHRFACFPAQAENYMINELTAKGSNANPDLVKRNDTYEIVDGRRIFVPKGFYISPFIRVKHLLQEVCTHMGYTLAPSFLDLEPFASMVFLNSTLDTIVNGTIRYVDIVPNIMVSTLFNVIRKFNMEIIPDEGTKQIHIVHFDTTLSSAPVNLTNSVAGMHSVNYHNNYKQLMLNSEESENSESLMFIETMARYPWAQLHPATGDIFVQAFEGEDEIKYPGYIVGSLASNYYSGGILSAEKKEFPDSVPKMSQQYEIRSSAYLPTLPDVGKGLFLHSAIRFDDNTTQSNDSDKEIPAMLCFVYSDAQRAHDIGTLSNYNYKGEKLWDYSLFYNGQDGIFERFWRNYDDLLRNALLTINCPLLLSESDKFTIKATDKINIQGQNYLIKELKYIPEEQSVQTASFLSLQLQHPISTAPTFDKYFTSQKYKWKITAQRDFTQTMPPNGSNNVIVYKNQALVLTPTPPTQAQYSAGGRYHQQVFEVEYGYETLDRDGNLKYTKVGDGKITTYLTPILA